MGAEAAYLSLNRGEGGQNLIGPELGEALGLVRTEELLAARRLDGARQFFTRAYDFGYSKTLDETWRHWPRDTILKDVVRIVRRFRPQVIVSVFSGTPAGRPRPAPGGRVGRAGGVPRGGRLAAASRSSPREEGLAPWAPLKLYRSTRFDTARHHPDARGRRARPRGGPVLSPDRHGGPQPAPLAGHGAAAGRWALAGAASRCWRTARARRRRACSPGIDTPWRRAGR